jgi:hypothetical protein
MKLKWKITLAIWMGMILFFGVGSVYAKEADLLLVGLRVILLLAAAAYTLFIWVRDLSRGETERKGYHLSAYPKPLLRFLFDEADNQPEHQHRSTKGV